MRRVALFAGKVLLNGVLAGVLLVGGILLAEATVLKDDSRPHLVTEVPAGVCPIAVGRTSLRCEVNAVRRANGLRPWQVNRRLRAAAQRFAQDMVRRRYFAHVSPEGRTLTDRARSAHYIGRTRSWAVGENIGWGTGTAGSPAAIVNAWMSSPPHRAILMSRKFREGGGGIARGTPAGVDGYTYVLDVGAKHTRSRGDRISGWEDGEAF